MDSVGPALVVVYILYIVGGLVAGTVIRARAGTGVWHRLKIFGRDGFGPVWFATAVICSMGWPITLAVWLARGRPEPRVVFNEKAFERQRQQHAIAAAGPPAPPVPAPPRSARPAPAAHTASPPPPTPAVPPVTRAAAVGPVAPAGAAVPPVGAPPRLVSPAPSESPTGDTGGDDARAAQAGREHADALRASDPVAEERARRRARETLGRIPEATAGSLQAGIVRGCLAHGLNDAAADELLFWSARVRTAGVALDTGRRTDCLALLDCALDFLETPDGARHRWAPEVRRAAVLLRPAVRDVLAAGVDGRAARVLDTHRATPPAVATPAARPVPPEGRAQIRSEDADRVLAAVLGAVVAGSGPVLEAVRAWVPDGSAPSGSDGALGRVRRGAGSLVGSSGPGTPGWATADAGTRVHWWSERMGAVVAAAVAAASTSGPVAERASVRPAVSMAGQAFVLCAVAAEFGITDRDELVGMLAGVLFGRTVPPAPADDAFAGVARELDTEGSARIAAIGQIAWRLGRSLLALRSELLDRAEPERRSRLTKVPGLGAVGGFLDERAALREVTASGIAWIDGRSASPGRPPGDLVSRSS